MTTIEDITGSIVIIAIVIGASIFMFNSYTRNMLEKDRYWKQYTLEERYGTTLNAMLEITEPNTNRTYGDILGSSAYYGTQNISAANGVIDLEKNFKKLLDLYYGDEDYYFEVKKPIRSLKMTFIIDGSNSTIDEAAYLAEEIEQIKSDIKRSVSTINETVNVTVYILQSDHSDRCENFTTVTCKYLDNNDIYFNDTYDAYDIKKYLYNLTSPEYIDIEPDVWPSDWETAAISLIIRSEHVDRTTMHVYLPLTDSLPSASQFIYPCPVDYASYILQRDKVIMKNFNVIMDPIFSVNIDPMLYCDSDVIAHMNSLITTTNGVIILNRDNFAPQVTKAILQNIDNAKIKIGNQKKGNRYVIERRLAMPNGKFADARLYFYQ